MDYKYGEISPALFNIYKVSLVDRIFKLLPLKEEECATIDEYIDTLNGELFGLIKNCDNATIVLSVINLLEHVRTETDHRIYRKEILKCCSLMKKVGEADV